MIKYLLFVLFASLYSSSSWVWSKSQKGQLDMLSNKELFAYDYKRYWVLELLSMCNDLIMSIMLVWSLFIIKWYAVILIVIAVGINTPRFLGPVFLSLIRERKVKIIYAWFFSIILLGATLVYLYV